MANFNLAQDVDNTRKSIKRLSCSYSGQILYSMTKLVVTILLLRSTPLEYAKEMKEEFS